MASLSDIIGGGYKQASLSAANFGRKYNLPDVKYSEALGWLGNALQPSSQSYDSEGQVLGSSTRPVATYQNSNSYTWPTTARSLTNSELAEWNRFLGSQQTPQFQGVSNGTSYSGGNVNPYSDMAALEAELQSEAYKQADREYARNREELEAQRGYAEQQKARSLSNLGAALEGVKGTVKSSKEEAQSRYDKDVKTAADTAQGVERKNRNVLRALGILGSSAAGEILSKPWTQFDQQKADLREGVRMRFQQLDDFMVQKSQEHANMVADLEDKYSSLVNGINRDLSFNAEERLAARQAANNAYRQRLAEIKAAQLNWEMAVQENKQNLMAQASTMGADTSLLRNLNTEGILGSTIQGGEGTNTETAGIYNPYMKEREEQGYVPASGYDPMYANYYPDLLSK